MNKNCLRIGGVSEHFNFPWQLALQEGAFAARGIAVDFVECPGGTGQMTELLRSAELDAALVLTEGAVADVINNNECRLVKFYVDSSLIWGIHVSASGNFEHLNSIRNKRFAISAYGSGSHLIAIMDAVARGWPTDEMKFVVVNSILGAREALAAGDADAFLWELHTTQPLVDSGEFRRLGERAVPWPAFAVSVRRECLTDNNDDLRTTLRIVERYAESLREKDNAATLVAEAYDLTVGDAASWLRHVRWTNGFQPATESLQTISDTLRREGLIDDSPFELSRIWHQL